MKPYIVLILMLCSIRSVAQIDYKRQLDSLTTVHKICTIESSIRNHRVKLDQLKKENKNLNTQLVEIQSFQLGRTDAEKEEQLLEINVLIEANATALTNAKVQLTTLINDLLIANEVVKDLQNR
ncbi:hypothetical protein LX77_00987 [Gelidibacter algens]|uniref:Uncharacterized protein n=1 Tax=Gelidibacter algens TaxID=49280 RepID=A0A1A7R4R1_9FLAO|nr:hypothetical protein [Gelidibacter algens]OBX26459.1 hypothetical protein A9996_03910 [Gelidibacter algens]RAJ26732.1 hypothetical protein LX77_00987 [Gelidibacter algens]